MNFKIKELFIPFDKYTDIGGPATFMRNLKYYLDNNGYQYTPTEGRGGGIFFPIAYDVGKVAAYSEVGLPVIQRLDGVHYQSKHGLKYLELNRDWKEIYLNHASYVIFQSEYSRKQCFELFGERDPGSYRIIFNGVNQQIFYPAADWKTLKSRKVKFVTTGSFRNIDMLEPVVKALDKIVGAFDFQLHLVGPVKNPVLEVFLNKDYIVHHGTRSSEEIAQILRDSDIFIYSHLNPPCPNSVLEAISTGLPVVGFDSGSMSELLHFSRELLAEVGEDVFQKYSDFDDEKLKGKILEAVKGFDHHKSIALENCNLYSFEKCGSEYLSVFKEQLERANGISRIKKLKRRVSRRVGFLIKKIKKLILRVIERLLIPLDSDLVLEFLLRLISKIIRKKGAAEGLKTLFKIDDHNYRLEGELAIEYGDGVHTKHKHTGYHNFFIDNISSGNKVLDVGCGYGALAASICDKVEGVEVYGIDISHHNIKKARESFNKPGLNFVEGDGLKDLPDLSFDLIILSNVLEHIQVRSSFLNKLYHLYKPEKFLIRVPCYDRDWRVPLRDELEIDYYLDPTHFIEYTSQEFKREIEDAGLKIADSKRIWGEIWAVVEKES